MWAPSKEDKSNFVLTNHFIKEKSVSNLGDQ